jgi:hypothetical protein
VRVGQIDRGIGRHLGCREARGFFAKQLAIGRQVVSTRRLAIPQRMLGEVMVLILLSLYTPGP